MPDFRNLRKFRILNATPSTQFGTVCSDTFRFPLCRLWDIWSKYEIEVWNCWHFRRLRTWVHDNHCNLGIKSDTGQHSQFLRCFYWQWHQHIVIDWCWLLLIDVDGVARVIYVKDHSFSHVGTAFPLLLFYSDIIQLKEFETSPVLYFLIHRFDPSKKKKKHLKQF